MQVVEGRDYLTKGELVLIAGKTSIYAQPYEKFDLQKLLKAKNLYHYELELFNYLWRLGVERKHFSTFGVAVYERPLMWFSKDECEKCRCYSYGVRYAWNEKTERCYETISLRHIIQKLVLEYLPLIKGKVGDIFTSPTDIKVYQILELFHIYKFKGLQYDLDEIHKKYTTRDIDQFIKTKWLESRYRYFGIPLIPYNYIYGVGIMTDEWQRLGVSYAQLVVKHLNEERKSKSPSLPPIDENDTQLLGLIDFYMKYLVVRKIFGYSQLVEIEGANNSSSVELYPYNKSKDITDYVIGKATPKGVEFYRLYNNKFLNQNVVDILPTVREYLESNGIPIALLETLVGGYFLSINLPILNLAIVEPKPNPQHIKNKEGKYKEITLTIFDVGRTYITFGIDGVSKILTHQFVRHKTMFDAVQTSDRYTSPIPLIMEWSGVSPTKVKLKDFALKLLQPLITTLTETIYKFATTLELNKPTTNGANDENTPNKQLKELLEHLNNEVKVQLEQFFRELGVDPQLPELNEYLHKKITKRNYINFVKAILQLTYDLISSYKVFQNKVRDTLLECVSNPQPAEIKCREMLRRLGVELQILNQYITEIYILKLPKEDVRDILPQSKQTKLIATFHKDTLNNFLNLRCDNHAQLEIRELCQLLNSFLSL